ncbi:MAG: ammonium transporter [Dehalococcoidia bacterium]
MPESTISAGDTAWVLAAAALVLIMTPGVAFFYGGMVRRKNAAATVMHSFMIIGIVSVVWVLWGYSLAFGPTLGGLVGGLNWTGLRDVTTEPVSFYGGGAIPHQAFMVFQLMFAIITPALITGAFAERMKFNAFVIFIVLWITIVYAPLAHWVWSIGADGEASGWMGKLGVLDFAGGTVVHISSGVAALAAAWVVFGRRLRFQQEPMEPHNVPMVVLGAALLWFGWFGFNAGSALAAGESAASAFVVTNTAAAAALVAWVTMSWIFGKKPSIIGAASGAVAGLVAITPASGFVGPMPAVLIGIGAGVFCYLAVQQLQRLQVDDSLAVWGVHGIGGTWGALATGLFFTMGVTGAVYTSDVSVLTQFGRQVIGVLAAWGWAFGATLVILLALKYTIGVRVSEEEEEMGLDLSQHGEPAYRFE